MLLFSQRISKLVIVLLYCSILEIAFADDKSVPLIWHVPSSNDYFVGRQEELQALSKIIRKYHKAVIIGPGGIGKTQLAKRYAHNNYHNYEIIWWFDMARNIDDQLNSLARQLNKPQVSSVIDINKISASAVLLHIKDILRTTGKSWLIIFDNVKNVDLIRDFIPESHNKLNKDILITTRNSNETLPSLYLKIFTPEESSQFLLQSTDTDDLSDLDKLSELLSFYPLALAQAAAYIKTNNMKISEYISLYNKDPYKLWKSEKQLVQNEGNYFDLNRNTIEVAVSLNFQSIQNESLIALEVIKIISLIKVALIPEYLLKDFIKTNENYNEEEFKAAIRVLKKYSLIEEQIKEGKKYYQVHDVIKKIVKKQLTEPINNLFDLQGHKNINQTGLEETYKKILKVMCMHLNKRWGEMVEYVNANSELINIANTVSFNAYKDKISDPLLIELIISLLEHNNMIFHAKSNYKTYQELAECLYELLEGRKIYVPLILQARYYFNGIYADFIYQSKEMSDKYEQKLIELLALLEEKPEFIEERFLSLINMAEFCFFRGNITQGIYYINKAHPLLQKISNANYRAQFWYALTWLYIEKGDYLKAHEYIKVFFDVTKNNKSYPIHLYAMNLRASVNFHLNNFKESYLWAEECYKRSMDFFQSDTSNIAAESLITLARYYKSNKDYVRSLEKIQKAINILNIIFSNPEIDPSQAVAHTLLGEIYVAQQQYKQAYDEYSFAEKYYTKLYKNNFSNINEVSRLFGNFVMLGIKTHDKILTRRYLRKLVDNFTYKNPTTSIVVQELSKHQLSILD